MYDALAPGQDRPEIIIGKDEPIISAIDSMYAHKTLSYRSKPLLRKNITFADSVVEPAKIWNNTNSE